MLPIQWPDGKLFAFTITDDCDQSELETVRPVYDLLLENGIRPTRTVWPLQPLGKPITGGDSLEHDSYARWVSDLANAGVEIAVHGVADEPSARDRVLQGFDCFRRVLRREPRMHINHVGQCEALYWGAKRLDPPLSWAYRAYKRDVVSLGDVSGSPYFWGDLCKQAITYVRNFTWHEINTLKCDLLMPYHDPSRPYVRYWFSATHASGVRTFCQMLSAHNLDRLVREGGACIIYTHLGSTFHPISREFKAVVRRLGSLPGWFAPASALLDYIGQKRGFCNTRRRRFAHQWMQWRWIVNQLRKA